MWSCLGELLTGELMCRHKILMHVLATHANNLLFFTTYKALRFVITALELPDSTVAYERLPFYYGIRFERGGTHPKIRNES